jgi:hypothetical protein
VLLVLAGCAAQPRGIQSAVSGGERRTANLERAARYPWIDEGACAVREADGEWRTLVERCYFALELTRIQFRDVGQQCPVAQVDAAALGPMVGMCLLVQPELVVGAVIVIGVVVVAAAIAAELQKLPCKCFCMAVDDLGKKHGPYSPGRTKNIFECQQLCHRNDWTGAAFCAK